MPRATFEQVLEVLGHLVVEYENLATGPAKTKILTSFLHQSLEGPIRDLSYRLANQNESEKTDLHLKFRSAESKIELLGQQLEISQKNENDYLKKYEDAVSERSSLADEYASRLASIEGQYTSLEKRYSKESSEWERKYDQLVATQKLEAEHMPDDLASIKARCSSTEARLSVACEQVESAKEEAAESRRKHDLAIKEVQKTVENITALKERAIQQAQEREDSLIEEFSATLAGKENKFQDSLEMLEEAEKMQSGLRNQLKVQEAELVALREEVKDLREKLNVSNSNGDLTERNFQILEQDRSYLQQRLAKQVKWSKELEQKYDVAETNAKRAAELAKKAQNDADIAQTEKLEFQRLVKQRLTEIEGVEKHLETLEREKADLIQEVERVRKSEQDAVSKVASLESRINERERGAEQFFQSTTEHRESTVQMLESLLATERDERLVQIRNAEKHLETLEREKANLIEEVERVRKSEEDAVSKLADLKSRIDERDREVEQLLQSTAEKRESTVQVLENLLATERASNAEANSRAEALSVQLQLTQGKLDALQQELNALRLNEKVMDNKPKTTIRTKRATRAETKIEQGTAVGSSVQDVMNVDEETIELPRKRTRTANIETPGVQTRRNNTNSKVVKPANSNAASVFKPGDDSQMTARKDSQDYTKLTVAKLKQELTNQGFASELLRLKNPLKKDILALYEKLILKR
jgi:chromosome segregation ATPase